GDRVEPIGMARVTRDEYKLVVFGTMLAPLEVVLDLGGLAIFIDAEETDIEVIARIGEVVRVAAIEGDLLFRGENQAHIGVAFEAIEVILTALVKGDDVAAQSGFLVRVALDV